jgi:hypothetical protein
MIEEFKPFIDDSKFKKLLHEFHREGWTNKGKILHKKLPAPSYIYCYDRIG